MAKARKQSLTTRAKSRAKRATTKARKRVARAVAPKRKRRKPQSLLTKVKRTAKAAVDAIAG